jgi:hypothetical protein
MATNQWAQGVARRPAFELVRIKTSSTRVYAIRERLWRWRKPVVAELIGQTATWLGRSAATWQVTASAKSVELPHGPINTPPRTGESRHAHHILEIPLAMLPFLV